MVKVKIQTASAWYRAQQLRKTQKLQKSTTAKPRVKRQSTMKTTANAGMGFLKAQRADSLIQFQGLDKMIPQAASNIRPKLTKKGTMVATAGEGRELVQWMGHGHVVSPYAKTRRQQQQLDTTVKPKANSKPKLVKKGTMKATAKEGKVLVKWMEEQNKTGRKRSTKTSKPKMKKQGTMTATANEGKVLMKWMKEQQQKKKQRTAKTKKTTTAKSKKKTKGKRR